MTEAQLIKACLQEDAAAQKILFEQYGSRMLGVCHRYARNGADAQDILQDAFIKIFDKLHQFKFEGSFEGWIRRIVVNTALKKYTVARYDKEINGFDNAAFDAPSTNYGAFNQLNYKEILTLIHHLPDGYRMIFNLYVMEGFQHDEIADMLNIQPSTSRSQLVKARNMLQKQIIALQKTEV